MNWILIALAGLLGLIALGVLAAWLMIPRRVPITSAATLRPVLEGLLSAPDPRGHTFVRVERGPESLQFHRREIRGNGARVFLEYPVKPWSEPYHDSVRLCADEAGYSVSSRSGDRAATIVDCGTDMSHASEFAWRLLNQAYDVGAGKAVLAYILYRA
jgi:hypothetical protein